MEIIEHKVITFNQLGNPVEPLSRDFNTRSSSIAVDRSSHIISKPAVLVMDLLVILIMEISWFCRMMLLILTADSGITCSSSNDDLTFLFEEIIFPNSCLLVISLVCAISTLKTDFTGL